jgi:hypothetical protein
MSHHLDSPIARQDIRLDITLPIPWRDGRRVRDERPPLNCRPILAPGYRPEGMYEFKIDLDGDAIEDITDRITFDEQDEHGKQRYVVRCIRGADGTDPDAAGTTVA